tara:strand:+ start:1073 stop:2803 length:1731 start_codon:yes stop_codon:yes gene_type:complete
MSELPIKYFNSFVLKKNVNNISSTSSKAYYLPVFPGIPSNPGGYPEFLTSTNGPDGRVSNQVKDPNNNIPPVKDIGGKNWIIEEARIKGGFNNAYVGQGPRAFLVEDSSEQVVRSNGLIYSGVFNSKTELNETNVFSVGEQITRSVDPNYGSIQKIHALDGNLAILQENKVSNALIDKDAIYSAEGAGTAVTSTKVVIGQITPYVGEYGISKNPESFAYHGYRRYFSDKYRNSVMRLSRDGLTEISGYGMSDFFRDKFAELSDGFKTFSFTIQLTSTNAGLKKITVDSSSTNLVELEKGMIVDIPQQSGGVVSAIIVAITSSNSIRLNISPGAPVSSATLTFRKFVRDRIVGGWDAYNKNYTISIQNKSEEPAIADTFETLTFEDDINGWTSFFDYEPLFIASSKNKYYTFFGSEIYEHYANQNRTEFYGTRFTSSIEFIFNANPSIVKNFKTVNYEGSNGWQVDSFKSDFEGFDPTGSVQLQYQDSAKPVLSYLAGAYTENGISYRAGFNRKENKYFANLKNNSLARPGEVFFGDSTTGVKGFLATVKVSIDTTTDVGGAKELFAVSTEFVVSSR